MTAIAFKAVAQQTYKVTYFCSLHMHRRKVYIKAESLSQALECAKDNPRNWCHSDYKVFRVVERM